MARDDLIQATGDADAAIRYWAATGIGTTVATARRDRTALPRDLVAKQLNRFAKCEDLRACERLRGELGVVFDWSRL